MYPPYPKNPVDMPMPKSQLPPVLGSDTHVLSPDNGISTNATTTTTNATTTTIATGPESY